MTQKEDDSMTRRIVHATGLGCLGFAVAVVLTGCGKGAEEPAAQKTGAAAPAADHDAGAGHAAQEKAPATTATVDKADDYPLDVCVVSGEKLGEDGAPIVTIQHEGRVVKFCCQNCVGIFKKDPAKYLAKLDAAAKKGGAHEGQTP